MVLGGSICHVMSFLWITRSTSVLPRKLSLIHTSHAVRFLACMLRSIPAIRNRHRCSVLVHLPNILHCILLELRDCDGKVSPGGDNSDAAQGNEMVERNPCNRSRTFLVRGATMTYPMNILVCKICKWNARDISFVCNVWRCSPSLF